MGIGLNHVCITAVASGWCLFALLRVAVYPTRFAFRSSIFAALFLACITSEVCFSLLACTYALPCWFRHVTRFSYCSFHWVLFLSLSVYL